MGGRAGAKALGQENDWDRRLEKWQALHRSQIEPFTKTPDILGGVT